MAIINYDRLGMDELMDLHAERTGLIEELAVDDNSLYPLLAKGGIASVATVSAVLGVAGTSEGAVVNQAHTEAVVQNGDNLTTIGNQVGETYQQLAAGNGISAPYIIYPGEDLKLDTSATASHTMVIQSGETFWSIETTDGYPHGSLQALNPEDNPRDLMPGTVINTPATTNEAVAPAIVPSTPNRPVIVQTNNSLSTIAASNGETLSQIEASNPQITNPSLIVPGQTVNTTNGVSPVEAPVPSPTPNPAQEKASTAVTEAPNIPAPAPTPAPAPAAETLNSPETDDNLPPTVENYIIRVLTGVANRLGIPVRKLVTQRNMNLMMAFGYLEEGDLGNTGHYNLYNTGIDNPSLLATANQVDGVQAFKSFDDGVEGTIETLLGSNQSRFIISLSNPDLSAEEVLEDWTYYGNTPGNTFWAQADTNSVIDGVQYSQTQYLQDLQTRYQEVTSDYTAHASVLLGQGYGGYLNNPERAPLSTLQFTGNGPAEAPTTTPANAPTTPAPQPAGSSQSRAYRP